MAIAVSWRTRQWWWPSGNVSKPATGARRRGGPGIGSQPPPDAAMRFRTLSVLALIASISGCAGDAPGASGRDSTRAAPSASRALQRPVRLPANPRSEAWRDKHPFDPGRARRGTRRARWSTGSTGLGFLTPSRAALPDRDPALGRRAPRSRVVGEGRRRGRSAQGGKCRSGAAATGRQRCSSSREERLTRGNGTETWYRGTFRTLRVESRRQITLVKRRWIFESYSA
jgi:hypothetical protein